MLRSVDWGEKVGQLFGGHLGRVLKVTALFACAVILLLGLYRVRTTRIINEETTKNQLRSVGYDAGTSLGDRWLIIGNPDEENLFSSPLRTEDAAGSESVEYLANMVPGFEYICIATGVAAANGWKTIVIGPHLPCCRKPNCHSMEKSQFLRLPYRSASVMRHLLNQGVEREPYKATIRNLAYLWAIHKGARFIFDAYVEEYQSAGIRPAQFEEEFSRQLQTLVLDESLSLVEERSKTRSSSLKTNPYMHFGRGDVKLLPAGANPGVTHSHAQSHGHAHDKDFPLFRICEVRPPSIEKFLEIDEGWWDTKAPSLVLPGDTMPPLCTRNTLFSPEVFWALPILPDYSALDESAMSDNSNLPKIPPWYIRGLWSQSLLGDLGGSIRLSLSRIPTLQISTPTVGGNTGLMGYTESLLNRTRGSRLQKRWSCRSKSTFRCLLLMAKELRKSVHFGKNDISLLEAFLVDLKSLQYSEPRMLPKRRSQAAPCLGADGLHGVSFHPALEPKESFTSPEFLAERQKTLNKLMRIQTSNSGSEQPDSEGGGREKRETERPVMLSQSLVPPSQAASYSSDWSLHTSDYSNHGVHMNSYRSIPYPSSDGDDSYLPRMSSEDSYEVIGSGKSLFPQTEKLPRPYIAHSLTASRTGRQFRAFLQEVVAKSVKEGVTEDKFPILKAMADNICPGFGPLLPFQPKRVESDILLIIAFTNYHYDLIPTLEVLYRSTYPNILYCGHPHESIEIFLRKYQTVERRSFSFLPTYTRATYECLLGAIEMNYDVKGYLLITDETLLSPSQIKPLNKSKLWVSSTGVDKVTRSNWQRIDPGGQKLPKLIEGITSAWTLFSYILRGQDSTPIFQPETKRMSRRKRSEGEPVEVEEQLEKAESAHINPGYQGDQATDVASTPSPKADKAGNLDLEVSDWDYMNHSKLNDKTGEWNQNENETSTTDEMDEVLVGEEDDEKSNMTEILLDLQLMETEAELSSTPLGSSPINGDLGFDEGQQQQNDKLDQTLVNLPRNLSEELDELRSSTFPPRFIESSTPADEADSSLGVPLYHVEHLDSPKPPKWRPPSTTEAMEDLPDSTSTAPSGPNSSASPPTGTNSGYKEDKPATSTSHAHLLPHEDIRLEMESLLDGLHQVYDVLRELVSDYEENNKGSSAHEPKQIHSIDFSSEFAEPLNLPGGGRSHRISPREFRHIRCTRVDDGHQSELCVTLRNYVRTLGENVRDELRLIHASTPLYYIPAHRSRSFYSIANVLLHYGVMDELALPLLFRGLAKEEEWINFNVSTTFAHSAEDESPKFLSPFDLHKVYGDSDAQQSFCYQFLLPIFSE